MGFIKCYYLKGCSHVYSEPYCLLHLKETEETAAER